MSTSSLSYRLHRLVPEHMNTFHTTEQVMPDIERACKENKDIASFHSIGKSEQGRSMYGVVLGRGNIGVSLIGGAHSDEPVGPETLRWFILEGLRQRELLRPYFEHFKFIIVPHINPDGEEKNQPWIQEWPDLAAYLRSVFRELPGRDLEFGFPAMRLENRWVAAFISKHAPLYMHMSLHGMAFSEGGMLLIERHWSSRTQFLRDKFVEAVQRAGLYMHDHNRKGEKGFFYIEKGFTTTPEGQAMRDFFTSLGDLEKAAQFHNSSMEYVRSLGGDPLCIVTELPLFLIEKNPEAKPGVPEQYLAFQDALPELKLMAKRGTSLQQAVQAFGLRYVPVPIAMRLQLRAIELGLKTLSKQLIYE